MSLLETMAKAVELADTYHTRSNKMRSDGNYHEVFYHSDPDAVSPVVVAAYPTPYQASQEASRLTRLAEMRAALLALADAELSEEVMEACAEAYEGAVAAAKEKTRAFWESRGQEVPANQRGVAPAQWLQPTLAAMLRAIAADGRD